MHLARRHLPLDSMYSSLSPSSHSPGDLIYKKRKKTECCSHLPSKLLELSPMSLNSMDQFSVLILPDRHSCKWLCWPLFPISLLFVVKSAHSHSVVLPLRQILYQFCRLIFFYFLSLTTIVPQSPFSLMLPRWSCCSHCFSYHLFDDNSQSTFLGLIYLLNSVVYITYCLLNIFTLDDSQASQKQHIFKWNNVNFSNLFLFNWLLQWIAPLTTQFPKLNLNIIFYSSSHSILHQINPELTSFLVNSFHFFPFPLSKLQSCLPLSPLGSFSSLLTRLADLRPSPSNAFSTQ